jgi:hypothetical protein
MRVNSRTLTLMALFLSSLSHAGVIYSAEMEKLGRKSSFEVWATNTKAKFYVTQSDDPSFPQGFTIIAVDQGARYLLLIPGKDAYVDLTTEQFKNFQMKKAQDTGFELKDVKTEELIVDDDGGLVAGLKTHHYKIKVSATGLQQGQKLDLVSTEEFWTAPSIPNPAPALDMLTEQRTGIPEIDVLLAYKKLRGYPLRRVVQLSINGQDIGTSVVEVKSIQEQAVPDSVFLVPPSYKKLEIPAQPTQGK